MFITIHNVKIALTDLPHSRKQALQDGVKYYYRPSGCKKNNDHAGVLRTHNGECYDCHKDRSKQKFHSMTSVERSIINEKARIKSLKKTAELNKLRGYALRDTQARALAKEIGLRVYYTGKPCKQGHSDPARFTRNGGCGECSLEYGRRTYHNVLKNDPVYRGKALERVRIWQSENPDKKNLNQANYYRRHIQKILAYHDYYRENNKAEIKTRQQDYAKRFPEKNRAKAALRRAALRRAAPPWIDVHEIEKIYANCPEGHDVDHIIPLQHERVCGLHVPQNLQYLPSSTNRSKGNKFPYFEGTENKST